jgi:hypothetical protein
MTRNSICSGPCAGAHHSQHRQGQSLSATLRTPPSGMLLTCALFGFERMPNKLSAALDALSSGHLSRSHLCSKSLGGAEGGR